MAASVSESVPASDSKSMEIKMELISLNDELVKLEYTYSVYVVNPEEEEKSKKKRKTKKWNLKAQPYINDHVTPFLTDNIFQSYKTLKLFHRFLNYNLLSRSQALTTMIRSQEQEEDEDEHDIAKTILKKTVYAAKGMVSEIRDAIADLRNNQELSSKKITLAEYVKDESNNINLPFEYECLGNIRIRAVLAAIQLSKRLSQFMFSLSDRDEELLEKVVSEIKKLTQKAENSILLPSLLL
ncbi:hypothetical protein PIB30_026220 [Stylosanthes scabra]|uniref:Uncharacterized protein n=1 Tax=Stylosanthes scabra TaxID=79078 RepID=A0ABU6Z9D9_9FABA|nr:hypothetical protein [Stylosanthes scabra]